MVERLQAGGVQVTAPANPLRGISIDFAYITSLLELDQTPGPVIAVGHYYGGTGITNAAANNVVGLVYVAAFASDQDETLADVESTAKDSVLNTALVQLQYPTG